MRAKNRKILFVAAIAVIVLVAALMVYVVLQKKSEGGLAGVAVAPPPSGLGYAVLNPVSAEQAIAGHEAELQAALVAVKQLGVNTVVQVMASTTAEADWAAYLNTVAGANMKAIVYFPDDPSPWTDFDNAAQGRFLKWAAANNPPALYAFYLVDEPFHTKHNPVFTTETLQRLYQHARQLAPNVPMLVQYSREIAMAESQGDTQHAFSSGQCDICVISTLEFSTQRGACNLDTGTLKSNHANSRRIIKAQAPDAQIWTTAEVFGATGGGEYCMGDSSGIQQMADLLFSNQLQAVGQLSGIIWQFWASPSTTQDAVQDTLRDSQFGAQRDVVKATAQRLGLPVPAP